MIVAIGSLNVEAAGIIQSRDYSPIAAPEDFVAYRSNTDVISIVVLSGLGPERAFRATTWAIKKFSPKGIISFGFCGATKENAQPGDMVVAFNVTRLMGTPFEWPGVETTDSLKPDRKLMIAARTAMELSGLDFHHGKVVTISQPAITPGAKHWLGETMDANAVDTDSYPIASLATDASIPWVSVSSVLDHWDMNIPNSMYGIGNGPETRGMAAYISQLASSPLEFPNLIRLSRSSGRAQRSLTTFMSAFMDFYAASSTE
jgi:nucleoside phosphorylase